MSSNSAQLSSAKNTVWRESAKPRVVESRFPVSAESERRGMRLGESYQAAGEIRDVAGDPRVMGKPIGRDVALLRPSWASKLGLDGAIAHFDRLVGAAIAAVPECRGAEQLHALVRLEAERLVPQTISEDLGRVTAQRSITAMSNGPAGLVIVPWDGWVDRCLGWRDRLLASRLFQRRAAAFALTRPVARRHACDLVDLLAGFGYLQVLLACVAPFKAQHQPAQPTSGRSKMRPRPRDEAWFRSTSDCR